MLEIFENLVKAGSGDWRLSVTMMLLAEQYGVIQLDTRPARLTCQFLGVDRRLSWQVESA